LLLGGPRPAIFATSLPMVEVVQPIHRH
jgi:hypothetical protein